MISIGFDDFFVAGMVFCLILLSFSWIRTEWQEAAHEWTPSKEQLCRCRNCGLTFLSQRTKRIARCPYCQQSTRIPNRKTARRITY